jgi:hypothetical protein
MLFKIMNESFILEDQYGFDPDFFAGPLAGEWLVTGEAPKGNG